MKIKQLCMLQYKKKNNENTVIDNIVYNQNDDKFYFKNPFDWIGTSDSIDISQNQSFIFGKNNNSNILVPIYIINILN